jgi:DeoR/GlpR family transcriptional regulator of sugar metabolism
MLESERHDRIASHVEKHGFLSLQDAMHLFQASRSTVRRDFDELASEQRVDRVRGGVRRRNTEGVLYFQPRGTERLREKDAIAAGAVRLLKPNDVLFVDGGTTTIHLAAHLPDMPLRIITVSVLFLDALAGRHDHLRSIESIATGGIYDPDLGIFIGPLARRSLADFHARWAFLTADGIGPWGVSNMNYLSVETKTEMIERAEKVAILADHSKIGKHAMTHVCGLEEVDVLVTDDWPENASMLETIRDAGVEVATFESNGDGRMSSLHLTTP